MNIFRLKKLFKNHFENTFAFYFMLLLTLVLGIIIGALLIKAFDTKAKLAILEYSNPHFYTILNNSYSRTQVFKVSMIFNLIFVGLTYLVSLLGFGFLIPIIIFIKGGFLGYSVGYVINNFGFKGFIVSIFGLYPQFLLYIPCLICIGAISMSMSYRYKLTSRKRVIKVKRLDFFDYTIFILFFTFIFIIGSLYEGYISPSFLNLLNIIL